MDFRPGDKGVARRNLEPGGRKGLPQAVVCIDVVADQVASLEDAYPQTAGPVDGNPLLIIVEGGLFCRRGAVQGIPEGEQGRSLAVLVVGGEIGQDPVGAEGGAAFRKDVAENG